MCLLRVHMTSGSLRGSKEYHLRSEFFLVITYRNLYDKAFLSHDLALFSMFCNHYNTVVLVH